MGLLTALTRKPRTLYELLKLGHLMGLTLIAAGLISVFLFDLRARQARTRAPERSA